MSTTCIHTVMLYTTRNTTRNRNYFHNETTIAAAFYLRCAITIKFTSQNNITDDNRQQMYLLYHDLISYNINYACESRKDELIHLVNKSKTAEEQSGITGLEGRRMQPASVGITEWLVTWLLWQKGKEDGWRPNSTFNTYRTSNTN